MRVTEIENVWESSLLLYNLQCMYDSFLTICMQNDSSDLSVINKFS